MVAKPICFVSLLLFGCAIQVEEVEDKIEPQQKTVYYNYPTSTSQETTCQTTVHLTSETGEQVVLYLKCVNPSTKNIKSDDWGTQDQITFDGVNININPPPPGDPR